MFLRTLAIVSLTALAAMTPAPIAAQNPPPPSRDLAAELRARVAAQGGVLVTFDCHENLRERACVGEMTRGDQHEIVSVTRPIERTARASRPPLVGLDLHPIFSSRSPILDFAVVGRQLLVLGSEDVTLHSWMDSRTGSSDLVATRAIVTERVWPRDLRGRLRVSTDSFDALLPGVTCRGTLAPFTLVCADEGDEWPLGIDNLGVLSGRNYFTTPEGFEFHGAAAVEGDTDRRWLVADRRGSLVFLDARRLSLGLTASSDTGDDIVALHGACAPSGSYAVIGSRATGPGTSDDAFDSLRLVRVEASRLTDIAPALMLPGTLASLWTMPESSVGAAVVHDVSAGRYEAFEISFSCAR